jgi:hypothetical protein
MSYQDMATGGLALGFMALTVAFIAYRRHVQRLVDEGNQRVQDAIANPLLTGINIGNGSIDIGMEGAGPTLLAGMFLGMFEKHPDAKNYIECLMTSAKGDVIVTVRKRDGATPDFLRREAERKLAEAEKALEELRVVRN